MFTRSIVLILLLVVTSSIQSSRITKIYPWYDEPLLFIQKQIEGGDECYTCWYANHTQIIALKHDDMIMYAYPDGYTPLPHLFSIIKQVYEQSKRNCFNLIGYETGICFACYKTDQCETWCTRKAQEF